MRLSELTTGEKGVIVKIIHNFGARKLFRLFLNKSHF